MVFHYACHGLEGTGSTGPGGVLMGEKQKPGAPAATSLDQA
jgi:hypothetical protein